MYEVAIAWPSVVPSCFSSETSANNIFFSYHAMAMAMGINSIQAKEVELHTFFVFLVFAVKKRDKLLCEIIRSPKLVCATSDNYKYNLINLEKTRNEIRKLCLFFGGKWRPTDIERSNESALEHRMTAVKQSLSM